MEIFSINDTFSITIILVSSLLSIGWAVYNAFLVKGIDVQKGKNDLEEQLETKNVDELERIGKLIEDGANAFLFAEYKIMGYFIIVFSIIIFVAVDLKDNGWSFRMYTTISFIIGSVASILCGYIGMKIAVMANFRTTFMAISSLSDAFITAYRAGCVMGFSMIGISLLILFLIIVVYKYIFGEIKENSNDLHKLMEMVAGYGLGGSAMALFGRVGGGIYTKAADVGADLVGKVEEGLDEDSPRNPATIADNVGDNVGDIAGMGSDLFGSFAESTCAALVLIAKYNKTSVITSKLFWFPLNISALGLISCFITSLVGIYIYKVNKLDKIQKALNIQLILSTVICLVFLFFLSLTIGDQIRIDEDTTYTRYSFMIPLLTGCISGLIIGYSTDYYTSFSHKPVKKLANSTSSGAALNIIFGLALGYMSTIIPVVFIVITIIVAISLSGMVGVALSALGMLSTLAIGLAIDAYGPISDNAGGIAEMSEIGSEIRVITDALDSAGNTTAAVGKGFAIGSAALVSFALYGAFISTLEDDKDFNFNKLTLTNGVVFGSLLFGAMLPYAFSALTMYSVGDAATEMVAEVRRQFQDEGIRNGTKTPDYKRCIEVSTNASLKQMIAPGLLIILTPIILGWINYKLVVGLLPGSLISGIQLAISMSNSGGAWDNAKKYIESGSFKDANGEVKGKGSLEHKSAVVGDTVGDPLKDTSGPSLNILIKLMAIISLVFSPLFISKK